MSPARADDHDATQALMARFEEAQANQGDLLREVLHQVKITNGRVTELERVRAVAEALAIERARVATDRHESRAWVPPGVVSVLCVVLAVVIGHFL